MSRQKPSQLKALAVSLILKEKIQTTEGRAKELIPLVEKHISRAKIGDIPARRFLAEFYPPQLVKKLILEIGPRYKERKGGYAKIIKLGKRKSDGAQMAIIELIK